MNDSTKTPEEVRAEQWRIHTLKMEIDRSRRRGDKAAVNRALRELSGDYRTDEEFEQAFCMDPDF